MDETVKKEMDKYLNNTCDFKTDAEVMDELHEYLCTYKEYATKFFSAKRNMYNEIANMEQEIFNATTSCARLNLSIVQKNNEYLMLALYKRWLNFFDKKLLESMNATNSDFGRFLSSTKEWTFKDSYAEDHYALGRRETLSIRYQLKMFIIDMVDTLKEIIQRFEGEPNNEHNDNKSDE